MLQIRGKIEKKLAIETGTSKSGKEWAKHGFVVNTGDKYNPEVCFSAFGSEKVEMLELLNPGDSVLVLFSVSSREFNGKYYHNLDAFKVNISNSVNVSNSQNKNEDRIQTDGATGEIMDDVPF